LARASDFIEEAGALALLKCSGATDAASVGPLWCLTAVVDGDVDGRVLHKPADRRPTEFELVVSLCGSDGRAGLGKTAVDQVAAVLDAGRP
jgi:hypothetical protein